MPQTLHLHTKCDRCSADVWTLADESAIGWRSVEVGGLEQALWLCPACINGFLQRCGIDPASLGNAEP
jgi:hypothetical protein